MLEILFWFSVSSIAFAYAGYPATIYLFHRFFGRRFKREMGYEPAITIIIAAANEEKKIAGKLENTASLDYPKDKLEVIVALDAPTDNTERVVREWHESNHDSLPDISTVVLFEKGGKEAAQNEAVMKANGAILVFTDVATTLSPGTLYSIASHFSDIRIGAVDGMSKIGTEDSNEGLYLKYENKIRGCESTTSGLVTLGGCLFAARGSFLKSFATENGRDIPGFSPLFQSDFRTALMTKTFGYHSILDTEAVALFEDLKDTKKEFNRKHRTIVRGINTFMHHLYLLNPFKYGLFSYTLFCHKLMKWLVPFFMIIATVTLVVLSSQSFMSQKSLVYPIMEFFMCIFYILGIVELPKFKIINFLLMSNLAILKAWWSYAKGERFVSWKPSER
jgi:cellulose synthase/poly-beta-1,6-N-acetylglucosamine synthase-like glycosyltransferase